MKTLKSILVITIILFVTVTTQAQKTDFPKLTGPYLGQKPPGMKPELFAPGIISLPDYFEHSAAIFSPDGNEVYWSGKPNGARYFEINFMKMINGRWTEPQVASFSQNPDVNFHQPSFSPDGNKLYFDTGSDIWVVERQGEGWAESSKISPKINSAGSGASLHLQTITENGSAYFRKYNPNEQFGKKAIIYISRKIKGNYTEPEILDENINSADEEEMAVAVAPDESYMIIEANKDNRTDELFISYKMKNGSWSERIKLPLGPGRFPSISPDGKYLFFMTRDGIYWVSAKFIEELRPM